jgi:hypothetical protein
VDDTILRVSDQRDQLIQKLPSTSHNEVRRHKAYDHTTKHQTG